MLCVRMTSLPEEVRGRDPKTPAWPWPGNSLAVTQDTIERDQTITFRSTGDLAVDEIKSACCSIGFHGAIPVVVGKIHQTGYQLCIFLRGQAGDCFFDFNNGAHVGNLADGELTARERSAQRRGSPRRLNYGVTDGEERVEPMANQKD